ncbi:MAG: hypothetical protein P8M78_16670 [Myxococcota bacterium]|nr:hypothetical protein [Myxococcota bacterium]
MTQILGVLLTVTGLLFTTSGCSMESDILNAPEYDQTCTGTGVWWAAMDDLNDCRDERDGPFEKVWKVIFTNSTLGPAALACVDGQTGPDGEQLPVDFLALARQACNRHNVTLKKDLVECVDKGLLFKTNESVTEACPRGIETELHEIADDALCELNNPTSIEDAGNGFFASCDTAVGPGPSGVPGEDWKPWNEAGCCKIKAPGSNTTIKHHKRGYEIRGEQDMDYRPFWPVKEADWSETFFQETESLDIWMCNPPSLEEGETRTHFYCAETSQDIMVEGWSTPAENPDRQGAGWCNVTTGDYKGAGQEVALIDQIFGDLTVAGEQMGKPKGVAPLLPGETSTDIHTCQLRLDAFTEHCSDSEIVSTHQFAYSMGAIVSGVWGIPIDFYGGSVVGQPATCAPDKACSIRNNCDPVPAIVRHLHQYAIYQWGLMSHAGPDGARRRNYRRCNGVDIVDNCVEPGGYKGVPQGPDKCGTAGGPPCVYQPWCSWNPYQDPARLHSGRENYHLNNCETGAYELISSVKACLSGDDMLDCLQLVAKLPEIKEALGPDHGFDDENDWGGYRVHTRPNWDVPRKPEFYGSIAHPESDPGGTGECDGPTRQGPLGLECVDIP